MSISIEAQNYLLAAAKQSIETGLSEGQFRAHKIESSTELTILNEHKATFVTLNKRNELRGCIGSLQAIRPLIEDVYHNAFSAAFKDPRFTPVSFSELTELSVSVSVLSTPQVMENCHSIDSFLAQLEPNRDGIIISDGLRRATFLPAVWQQLPDKTQFVMHLMQKAGMTKWSENMRCERYYSHSFEKDWLDIEV